MKKFFILLSFISISISITIILFNKVNAQENETVYFEFKTPYYIDINPSYVAPIDIGVEVKSAEIIDSICNTTIYKIDNSKIYLNVYDNDLENVKILEDFNIFGMPLAIGQATLKIGISEKDIKELKSKNIITDFSNRILGQVHKPFCKKEKVAFIDRKIEKDLYTSLTSLCKEINDKIETNERLYIVNHQDLINTTLELTKDEKTQEKKALKILNWIRKNVKDVSQDETITYENPLTVNDAWVNRKGVCENKAYLGKVMLDILNIENYMTMGYIINKNTNVIHKEIGFHVQNVVELDNKIFRFYDDQYSEEFKFQPFNKIFKIKHKESPLLPTPIFKLYDDNKNDISTNFINLQEPKNITLIDYSTKFYNDIEKIEYQYWDIENEENPKWLPFFTDEELTQLTTINTQGFFFIRARLKINGQYSNWSYPYITEVPEPEKVVK